MRTGWDRLLIAWQCRTDADNIPYHKGGIPIQKLAGSEELNPQTAVFRSVSSSAFGRSIPLGNSA